MKEDKRYNFPDIVHPMFWKEHMRPLSFKGFTLFGDVSKSHKPATKLYNLFVCIYTFTTIKAREICQN